MKSVKNIDSAGLTYIAVWVSIKMIECAGKKEAFVLRITRLRVWVNDQLDAQLRYIIGLLL